MNFSSIRPGDHAKVIGYTPNSRRPYLKKLLALGLIPGVKFQVSRLAPLGDPIEIIVKGCSLCLRKAEANLLKIEPLEDFSSNTQ